MYEVLMRDHHTLPRLYIAKSLHAGALIDLPQPQAHFLNVVMRKARGERVRVFNSADGEWRAHITAQAKRKVQIKILERLRAPRAAPDIWLLFAPVKKARNNFIVEKAVELGAAHVRPVITARTSGRINMEKMHAHIIEAAEQTERLDLPSAKAPMPLTALLQTWDTARILVFADEAGGGAKAAKTLAAIKPPCAILIGPEGGFTGAERTLLKDKAYVRPISLGPRILRAETAAVATLALWQAVSGDWGE